MANQLVYIKYTTIIFQEVLDRYSVYSKQVVSEPSRMILPLASQLIERQLLQVCMMKKSQDHSSHANYSHTTGSWCFLIPNSRESSKVNASWSTQAAIYKRSPESRNCSVKTTQSSTNTRTSFHFEIANQRLGIVIIQTDSWTRISKSLRRSSSLQLMCLHRASIIWILSLRHP